MAQKKENFFKRFPWVLHVLIMIGVSIVLLMLAFLFIKIYAREGQEYELPDLVGINIEDAKTNNTIELDYIVLDSTFRPGQEGGKILTQDPKAGTLVKKGRKVYITMTAYTPEDAVLPELTGLTLRQAISELINIGLTPGTLKFVDDPYKNNVISQSSRGKILYAGQQIERGAIVDLTIGLGDGKSRSVVPFVIGKTAEKARRDILSASLNVGKEHFQGVKNKATAVVNRQEPDYTGVSRYDYGTAVELWYIDAEKVDVDKMVREFKVDSSKIISPDSDPDGLPTPDEIDANETWIW